MQWDATPGRGFSTGEPWLPYGRIDRNVAVENGGQDSLLALTRRAIWLRKRTPVLREGSYRELEAPGGVFAFERFTGTATATVAINATGTAVDVELRRPGTVILSTDLRQEGIACAAAVRVEPFGAVLVL